MVKLKITGMSCGHCESAVTKALQAVPGVEKVVSVSHQSGEAVVEGSPETQQLLAAVKEEGYEVEVAG